VISFRNDGNLPPIVVVENLDGFASAAIKYQERDSGAWADIPGTNATILPGKSDGQILSTATLREVAIHAAGNVKLLVHVLRQLDGEQAFLGNIL
jgi:hypothetical protein